MKTLIEFLNEATLDQTKEVLRKAEWNRENTDKLYPTIFNKKFKTDSNRYRVYLPFSFDYEIPVDYNPLFWDGEVDFEIFSRSVEEMFGKDVKTMQYIYKAFKSFVDTEKFQVDKLDYQNGYFFDIKDRPVKISKVFQNLIKEQPQLRGEIEDYLRKFNDDRLRDGTSKIDFGNLMIVITKNPMDIVNQSTDRRWTSCMNLTKGEHRDYVPEDIKHGTIMAYLTDKSDVTIRRPLARLSIKPYVGAFKGKVLLNVGETCYNVLYGNFVDDLINEFGFETKEFIDENFNSKKVKDLTTDVYFPHKNLYKDEPDPAEINRGRIDTEEKMMKKIRPYGGDLVWEALRGNWIFVARNNRYGIINIKGDIILPPNYSEIEQADDQDLKLVKVYYGSRVGLYNIATEDFIIYPYYSKIESMTDFYYHEGNQYVREELNGEVLADVEFKDGTRNYIDKSGKLFYQKNIE